MSTNYTFRDFLFMSHVYFRGRKATQRAQILSVHINYGQANRLTDIKLYTRTQQKHTLVSPVFTDSIQIQKYTHAQRRSPTAPLQGNFDTCKTATK